MIATIRDPETLRALRPLELVAYLRARHWHEVQRLERGAFWEKDVSGKAYEVLVPLDATLRDFPNRMAEALQTLQEVEQRSQLEIVEDLATTNADIVRPRLPGISPDGGLSIEQGALIHEQARNLLLAAACSALENRPLHARRKPEKAMEYLQHARFGMPQRGSYVLTIISPVSPKISGGKDLLGADLEPDDPFERRTIRTLAHGLYAVEQACREVAATGEIDPMRKAVERGVSANLCEAIIGLNQGGGEAGVQFSFAWAPLRGAPPDVVSSVSISPDFIPILQETARIFRDTATVESSEVIGTVNKLEHIGGDHGKITIVGSADGVPRTVTMELFGKEHLSALRSYEERIPIVCVGELTREGRSWILRNPREFSLLEEKA